MAVEMLLTSRDLVYIECKSMRINGEISQILSVFLHFLVYPDSNHLAKSRGKLHHRGEDEGPQEHGLNVEDP